VTRTIAISLDQFYRAQPGGIATYVRGLVGGLRTFDDEDLELVGIAPRGAATQRIDDVAIGRVTTAPLGVLNRLWARWPLGVPKGSNVVHATSLTGPFGGGANDAVHSVALFDLLWRDEPSASTPRGIRFHEGRLQLLKRHGEVRLFCASPGLAARLAADGFAPERLHDVRLGVDSDIAPESPSAVCTALVEHGVSGPFTLYVGTREPRKNLERLVAAHAQVRARDDELGPLVVVGPSGWGEVNVGDAVILGSVSSALLKGLYRDATVVAYVPLAEGWGLPPVEALAQGTRVLASTTTPSVALNTEVVLADPRDVEAIAQGLTSALAQSDDDESRSRRSRSVAELTWHNVALDHLAGWR
jgi:glycosyltransferase involved in cell wall biosynthesis